MSYSMIEKLDLLRPHSSGLMLGAKFRLYPDGELFIESYDVDAGGAVPKQYDFVTHMRAEDVAALKTWLLEGEKSENVHAGYEEG